MRLNLFKQAQRIKLLYDECTRVVTIQSMKTLWRFIVNLCVGSQDVDLGQLVSFAHRVIVEIMSRRNLYTARTKLLINIFIGDNLYISINDRNLNGFSNKVFITFVIWIYCNCSIA